MLHKKHRFLIICRKVFIVLKVASAMDFFICIIINNKKKKIMQK